MTDYKHESLSESRRTVVYAVVAALSVSLGVYTYVKNQPKPMKEFEKVGTEFYPDFKNTDDATSLFVAKYDQNEEEVKTFEVEQVDGQWRIPTHYNYPADAAEQLAKTAASIMGIRREALISRHAADHEKLGVVDPESKEGTNRKGRGERITIRKGDAVLADYIIGKSYPGRDGAFYIRAPQEKETYVAHVKVDLSTKFQDWIDTDLLKIDRTKLNEIAVKKYSFDTQSDELTDFEQVTLTREGFGKPWELEDLNDETEEVNHDAVKELVSELVDTKIVGVRPKPQGLTPELEFSPAAARSEDLKFIMNPKGFEIKQISQTGEVVLLAKDGSFYVCTNEGVCYGLYFGDVFSGDLKEIEIGKPDEDASSEKTSGEETNKGQDTDSKESEGDSDDQQKEEQQYRYLFVRVTFDPVTLGPEPTRPEPPEDPGPVDPNAPLSAPRPGEPSLSPLEKFELAEKKYEADLKQFEQDLKTYQEKVEAGSKKAKALSDRLGAWYYVIPAKNVEALRVSRADLVQPKGTDAAKKAAQQQQQRGAGSPQLPFTPDQLKPPQQN